MKDLQGLMTLAIKGRSLSTLAAAGLLLAGSSSAIICMHIHNLFQVLYTKMVKTSAALPNQALT